MSRLQKAVEGFLEALTLDRHDTEDWPIASWNAMEKLRIEFNLAKERNSTPVEGELRVTLEVDVPGIGTQSVQQTVTRQQSKALIGSVAEDLLYHLQRSVAATIEAQGRSA